MGREHDNPTLYESAGMRPQCTFIVHFHSCRLDAGHPGKHSPGRIEEADRLRRMENALLRTAGFFPWEDPNGKAWIHESDEGYVMDREQAVNDALTRLAERALAR